MDNYIIKTIAYNKQARIFFVDNTNLIREICDNKGINKLLKTALGRTVSIASLVSGTLKGNQRISLKVNASNRKHKALADADSMGNIRGYISDELLNASLDFTENLSVEDLIGNRGCIQVMKDLGMNSIYTGRTIRTLHHYDAIGLICPLVHTNAGHRLYSECDIIKLQQIISLKQIGFSLEEIKEVVDHR
ncbi:Hsp33 family molecular chaperone HslO [Clostridium sp.]|uniref:Hsp33 family molecular chaperone HslO n=1 Tax=Clostridium sp. TaxID=1506 RepID=UPI002FC5A198